MDKKPLGWIFGTDGFEGVPYFKCPYCGRKVSGIKAVFADIVLEFCPDCGKNLHFDNIKEEDWLYVDSFFGED